MEVLSEIINLLKLNKQKGKKDFWNDLSSEKKAEINSALKDSLVVDKLVSNSNVFDEYKK